MNLIKKNILKLKFIKDFVLKKHILSDGRFPMKWKSRYACLNDATTETGYDSHYLYHTAWAARILSRVRPSIHRDISSCLRFVSLVSAFIPIQFYDYRPASLNLDGLTSYKGDLMNLPFADGSIESISCMHVIEHIGLERYGDSFDPQGDLKAINELKRVVMPNGTLLIVVPLGENPQIQYNAHRIYSLQQVLDYFKGFELADFSYIDDAGTFHSPAKPEHTQGQIYGCGCFHFVKIVAN